MKWLLGAVILVGAVWWMTSDREEASVSEAPAGLPPAPSVELSNEAKSDLTRSGEKADFAEAEAIEEVVAEEVNDLDQDGVINIGEPMDPDDPSTWPVDENTEVINIGEPMDPDDPSTWPVDENTEVINIGEPMDPDDPSTWPVDESTEVINIGEPMDPDDPLTWAQPEGAEVINIGEPMDPDDPSTWPRDGR